MRIQEWQISTSTSVNERYQIPLRNLEMMLPVEFYFTMCPCKWFSHKTRRVQMLWTGRSEDRTRTLASQCNLSMYLPVFPRVVVRTNTLWRQWLASYCTSRPRLSTGIRHRYPAALPSFLCNSRPGSCWSYSVRSLPCVVPGTWPLTFVWKHSLFTHTRIALFPSVVFSVSPGYEPGVLRQRESGHLK